MSEQEKLTACGECRWSQIPCDDGGTVTGDICRNVAASARFDCFSGEIGHGGDSPHCEKVNTDGHCEHFESKEQPAEEPTACGECKHVGENGICDKVLRLWRVHPKTRARPFWFHIAYSILAEIDPLGHCPHFEAEEQPVGDKHGWTGPIPLSRATLGGIADDLRKAAGPGPFVGEPIGVATADLAKGERVILDTVNRTVSPVEAQCPAESDYESALLRAETLKPRWIPVGERAPAQSDVVAMLTDTGHIRVGRYGKRYYPIGEYIVLWDVVTHWMPLPARPEPTSPSE